MKLTEKRFPRTRNDQKRSSRRRARAIVRQAQRRAKANR
jgi:hypothetical protein